jgi:hypothetical protein
MDMKIGPKLLKGLSIGLSVAGAVISVAASFVADKELDNKVAKAATEAVEKLSKPE